MTNDDTRPVAQRGRQIPHNLEPMAKGKLDELLEEDIVEPVPTDEPRTWVSPPVIALKPNSQQICFCIDIRAANKAIERPNAKLPVTDEIIDKFRNATTFSKLDLKEAYHQFELEPGSRHLTTFHGPDKLYRYKRLNYGMKSAHDILHNEMVRLLAGIPNQANVADDILIGGTQADHDGALDLVLNALDTNNITVNTKKCLFDVGQLSFLGLTFGKGGVKPDQAKIDDLMKAEKPQSREEVRSYLGMARFSQRFIPSFAQSTAPLREAVTTEPWKWGEEQDSAFKKTRNALREDTVHHLYEVGAQTQVTVDASPGGLGAVLAQMQNKQWVPVVYKSRSLKDAETRYSQTEREALAIRWGVQKLRKYLLGAPRFQIITDHKPLQFMFSSGKQDLPPRIERFIMDIQGYDWEVIYKPGKNNIADYLSRHPVPRQGSSRAEEVDDFVKRTMERSFTGAPGEIDAMTLEEVTLQRIAAQRCGS